MNKFEVMEVNHKKIISKNEIVKKTSDNIKLFSSIIKSIFEMINDYISTKNPYYNELYGKTQEYINNNQYYIELNADKYIPLFIKSLLIDNYKLQKNIFPNLALLIKNNFMLGKIKIIEYQNELPSTEEIKKFFTPLNIQDKNLIDLLIIALYSINEKNQNEEDILFYISDIYSEIIHNKYIMPFLFGENFSCIYTFYYNLYIKFYGEEKRQKVIKDNLNHFVDFSFQELKKFYDSNVSSTTNEIMKIYNNSYSKYLEYLYNNLKTVEIINNSNSNNYNPIDILVCRTVKTIVDTICFRDKTNMGQIHNLISPLIPQKESDFGKSIFRYVKSPNISNEYTYSSGFFGWCYICRKTSSHYCLDHRLPICSFICKNNLMKEEEQLNHHNKYLLKDCIKMLEYFSDILSNNYYYPYQKILILEIISNIIVKFGDVLNHSPSFVKVVKKIIKEGLVKTCINKDIKLFTSSINVYNQIFFCFKQHLKKEIKFFNENILIQILIASNDYISYKKIILENFTTKDFYFYIELFINYDCDLTEKFLSKKLISTFCDIINNKYNPKSSNFYIEKDANELINLVLKILSSISNKAFDIAKNFKTNNKHENEIKKNYDNNIDECESEESDIDCDELNDTVKIYNISNISNTFSSYNTNNLNSIEKKNTYINEKKIINEGSIKEIIYQKDINYKDKNDEIVNAAEKFNKKIEYGLSYMKINGLINTASIETISKDIIHFIKNSSSLNKRYVGELLAQNNYISNKILELYSDDFNFKNMNIVKALRTFFSYFIMPKNFGKIYQVFSYKFYKDNSKVFDNSELVLYLTYIILILQNNFYYSKKKNKIEFSSFFKLFEKRISEDILKDIYEQIKKEPIFKGNKEDMNISMSWTQFQSKSKKVVCDEISYKIFNYNDIEEYLSQFILSIWKPVIFTYKSLIEDSNEQNLNSFGIMGMIKFVQIMGLINLDSQKKLIIDLICLMTNLFNNNQINDKNILCIKQILLLANDDSRFCKGGWNGIVEIINKLHYYYLLSHMSQDEREIALNKKFKNNKDLKNKEEAKINKLPKLFSPNTYEKIFNKASNSDIDSLTEFTESLCEICKNEFIENGITKNFFLEKITEIINNNFLSETKKIENIVKIWKCLSNFCVNIAIINDIENSNKIIDVLKLFVSKFLKNKNINGFHIQSELFQPFLQIINRCQNITIKEYIFTCINNLIKSYPDKIKYGWIIVLNIYKELYRITNLNNLKVQALTLLENFVNNYFSDLSNIFSNFTICLKLYVNQYPNEVKKIIKILFNKINIANNYLLLIKIYQPYLIHEDEEIRNSNINELMHYISKEYTKKFTYLSHIYKNEYFWSIILDDILYLSIYQIAQKIIEIKTNKNNLDKNYSSSNSTNNNSFNDSLTDISSTKSTKNNTNEDMIIKYGNTLRKLLNTASDIFNEFFCFNYKKIDSFFDIFGKIIFYEEKHVQMIGFEVLQNTFNFENFKNVSLLQPLILFLSNLISKSFELCKL